MSKKLIAVASAAALALTALVGVAPASANTFSVEVQKTSGENLAQSSATTRITATGITAAAAYNVNVPSANVLRSVTSQSLTTAAEFHVTTTTARGEVTVTATGGVRLLTETQLASVLTTVATGTTSLTDFSSSSKFLFYAYNTSTTAGTVVISNAGNSRTIFLAGESDWAYSLKLSGPASVGPGGNIDISGTIVDAFGNNLTTPLTSAADHFDFAQVGVTAAPTLTYTAATQTYRFRAVAPTTAIPVALQIALDSTIAPTAVTAFGTPVASQFFTVQVTDLAVAVASLTAQVAALTADYNKLAERWNKRFDLKKAPKKKVALK
jgi:hypothetical protein